MYKMVLMSEVHAISQNSFRADKKGLPPPPH